MGSGLVAAALLPLAELELSPRARLVLTRMCSAAKDADTPPIYFGGWGPLAEALGFATYTRSAHSAVARAVKELLECGVIKSYGAPGPGHNVTYEIRLWLWKT